MDDRVLIDVTNCNSFGFDGSNSLEPLVGSHYFRQRIFALSSSAVDKQVYLAVVWRKSGRLDDGHAVLPVHVVLGLRLLAFFVLPFELEQPSSCPSGFAHDCIVNGVLCNSVGFLETDGNGGSNFTNTVVTCRVRRTAVRCFIDDGSFDSSLVFTSVSRTLAISIVLAFKHWIAPGPWIVSIYL